MPYLQVVPVLLFERPACSQQSHRPPVSGVMRWRTRNGTHGLDALRRVAPARREDSRQAAPPRRGVAP